MTTNTRNTRPAEIALVPYCGKPHRLIDGAPLAHKCHVIPPESLSAAVRGEFQQAISLFAGAGKGTITNSSGCVEVQTAMTATQNPMFTLVEVPCVVCGSTADTVKRDRELHCGDGVCCSRSPQTACWVCSAPSEDPYWSLGRPFCSRQCFCFWAE